MNGPGLIFIALIGWAAGALVNYLADVLPYRRRLARPFCHACAERYTLVGYLFWPRRCLACGRRRALRVWLVEAIGIAAAIWLWTTPLENRLGVLASALLLVYFGVVVVIDLEHRLILHVTSLAGALLGLAIGVWLRGWSSTLLGGLAGFAGMLGLYYLGFLFLVVIKRLRGKSTSEVALGFGDVMLSGVLGLLLGWPGILAGLYLAIFIGAIFSLVYLISMALLGRYKAFTPIPYGPFLVLSAVLLLFFKHIFI